jgi:hypothetical protein
MGGDGLDRGRNPGLRLRMDETPGDAMPRGAFHPWQPRTDDSIAHAESALELVERRMANLKALLHEDAEPGPRAA